MGWRVRGSNSGGREIFGTRPDWRWVHPSSYTMITVSFPVVQWLGHGVNPLNPELNPICHLLALLGAHHILHVSRIRVKHPPKSSAEVKQRVEQYGYSTL